MRADPNPELVEKVARAIQAAHSGRPADEAYWATECTGAHCYRLYADAAIRIAGEWAAGNCDRMAGLATTRAAAEHAHQFAEIIRKEFGVSDV